MADKRSSRSRARPAAATEEAPDTQWVWNGNPLHLQGRIVFANEVLSEEDIDTFGDSWEAEVAAGRLVERPKGTAVGGAMYEAPPPGQQQFVGSTQGGGIDPTKATSAGPGSSGNETVPTGGPGGTGATTEAPDAVPTEVGREALPAELTAEDLKAEAEFRRDNPGAVRDADIPAGYSPDALEAAAAVRSTTKGGGQSS